MHEAAKRDKAQTIPEGWFRASELGLCPRKLYYLRTGAQAKRRFPKNLFRLEDGSWKHEMIQKDLESAGVLIAKEFLAKDTINRIQGHPDGAIGLEEAAGSSIKQYFILEIKTVQRQDFDSLHTGPFVAHYKQANFYGILSDIPLIYFLYYCADNGKTKEFIMETDMVSYQQSVNMVNYVRGCIVAKEVPVETVKTYCFCCEFEYLCREKKRKRVLVV